MRRGGWWITGLGLLLALPATAQIRQDFDPWGRYLGQTERRGGALHHYDAWGGYEGRSERSAGGGVLRHYDRDGRYLGREEAERDFRRRRNEAPGPGGNGVQIYVDPLPFLNTPPDAAAEPEFQRGRTPWFRGEERRR